MNQSNDQEKLAQLEKEIMWNDSLWLNLQNGSRQIALSKLAKFILSREASLARELEARQTGCWHGDKGHPCALDQVESLQAENVRLAKSVHEASLEIEACAYEIAHKNDRIDSLQKSLAELETELQNYRIKANISRCSYCGEEGPDDLERVSKHMANCVKRPENALIEEIDRLNQQIVDVRAKAKQFIELLLPVVKGYELQDSVNPEGRIIPPYIAEVEAFLSELSRLLPKDAGGGKV